MRLRPILCALAIALVIAGGLYAFMLLRFDAIAEAMIFP